MSGRCWNGEETKKSRYTDEHITCTLKPGDTCTMVEEICRQRSISNATYYNWKKKFDGLGPSEVRKLEQLEEENKKLKQMVAGLRLDKPMLQDVLKKV